MNGRTGTVTPVAHSCLGFGVRDAGGELGVVEAIAADGRALSVGSAAGSARVALADVELVDSAERVLHCGSSHPRAAALVARGGADCACPTDFVCACCGYGVAGGHLPRLCPMCGGHRWRLRAALRHPMGL